MDDDPGLELEAVHLDRALAAVEEAVRQPASVPGADLLGVLYRRGPLPTAGLAREARVGEAEADSALAELADMRLVARAPGGWRVTGAGRELVERARTARVRALAGLLAGLEGEERELLGRAATLLGRATRR